VTTIILADDHHLIRKSLRFLLEAESGFKVVAEAADGVETLEAVKKKRPDVLLLDLAIPRMHGLDVVQEVAKTTKTKVLIVSMHSAEAYVVEALANGAAGYILKHSMPVELITGIREVAAGRPYLSTELSRQDIMMGVKSRGKADNGSNVLNELTRREKIVLQLAAEGHSSVEIGRMLFLSPRTVESHRASLMRKLKLRSQTDIVRFAVRKSIISV
jgi:DNA-binding NarL/FixJ family response regulator